MIDELPFGADCGGEDPDSRSAKGSLGSTAGPSRRRSRSLEKRDSRDLILGQFSITDAVAEADERDFRAPRSRRAISKPDIREPGPMLSSTIDDDSDFATDPDDSDIAQLRGLGNRNKSESLKESFKRRGPDRDDLREKAENDRKDRRKDRFDTERSSWGAKWNPISRQAPTHVWE